MRIAAYLCLVTIISGAEAGLKGHGRKAVGQGKAATQSGPLRKTRQAAPRKLGAESLAGGLGSFLPKGLMDSGLGGILSMPRDLLSNIVGGSTAPIAGAAVGGAQNVQRSVGDFVDRTRTVADSSLDTVEQIAQGMAQRSRSVLDRATSRAAGFVDNSVALGTNTLGAGLDAARGLHEEARRAAAQAAGAANGAVRAGEIAFAGAFDKLATAVNQHNPTQDGLLGAAGIGSTAAGLQSLLGNPLNSIIGLAAGNI